MQTRLKLFIIFLVIYVFILLFGFIAYGPLKRTLVYRQKSLRPGTIMEKIYTNYKKPFSFCVYFFNVTNTKAVSRGEMPELKEVGPYCYSSYKTRIDPLVDKIADTIELTPHFLYFADEQMTSPLNHEDYVTILNPFFVGIVNAIKFELPYLMPKLQNLLNHILMKPKSVYITVKVKDILFDGIPFNCSVVEDIMVKTICVQVKNRIKNVNEDKNNMLFVSLFQTLNGTAQPRVQVRRGVKNKYSGEVLKYNNATDHVVWATPKCNEFKGTDGWINKPFLTPKIDTIDVVAFPFCRNFEFRYKKTIKHQNVPLLEYHAKFDNPKKNEYEKCFCPETGCLNEGAMNIYKCTKLPVIVTLPHFFYADSYMNQVKGLVPDLIKHTTKVKLDKLTGSPVIANIRFQLNMEMGAVPEINVMKKLPSVLHPVLWFDDSMLLQSKTRRFLMILYFALMGFELLRWAIAFISLIGILITGSLLYRARKRRVTVEYSDDKDNITQKSD